MKRYEFDGPMEDDTRAAIARDPAYAEAFFEALLERPVSAQLAILRRLYGRTQGSLARELGLKQTHISRLERAGSDHRMSFFEKAAARLGARIAVVPRGMRLVPGASFQEGTHSFAAERRGWYRAEKKKRGRA